MPHHTKNAWNKIEGISCIIWNLPNALSALDSKHVAKKRPKGGGSQFFNYKGFHSIVLQTPADHNYRFICVSDVSSNRSWSD